MQSKPILSICIPIYNRKAYLERMLERFFEDKDMFAEKIHLFISDNCSKENIKEVCEYYNSKGLSLTYYCNETNLGMDGNFDNCFKHAEGKYVWVLGSDDIPRSGILIRILKVLEEGDYGLVHLSMTPQKDCVLKYENRDEMLIRVCHWITYLSANIIKTDTLNGINLKQYYGSFITQVPAYLNACCSCSRNAIVYYPKYFDGDDESLNNGGYNIFKVFVENLFIIYQHLVNKGFISERTFNAIKKREYKDFIIGYIIAFLILHKESHFDIKGAWGILWKHYGNKPYAYYFLGRRLLAIPVKRILRPVMNIVKK